MAEVAPAGFFLGRIAEERAAQDAKWGADRDLDDYKWLPILMEEVGEVANAILENATETAVRDELVQVAAVAVAWLECIDRNRKSQQETTMKRPGAADG